jgi:hypothetical protein
MPTPVKVPPMVFGPDTPPGDICPPVKKKVGELTRRV